MSRLDSASGETNPGLRLLAHRRGWSEGATVDYRTRASPSPGSTIPAAAGPSSQAPAGTTFQSLRPDSSSPAQALLRPLVSLRSQPSLHNAARAAAICFPGARGGPTSEKMDPGRPHLRFEGSRAGEDLPSWIPARRAYGPLHWPQRPVAAITSRDQDVDVISYGPRSTGIESVRAAPRHTLSCAIPQATPRGLSFYNSAGRSEADSRTGLPSSLRRCRPFDRGASAIAEPSVADSQASDRHPIRSRRP